MKNSRLLCFYVTSLLVILLLNLNLSAQEAKLQFNSHKQLKLLAASREESSIHLLSQLCSLTPPQAAGNARAGFKIVQFTDTHFYVGGERSPEVIENIRTVMK